MKVRCMITTDSGNQSDVTIECADRNEAMKIQLRITAALRLAQNGIYDFKTLDGVPEGLQSEISAKIVENETLQASNRALQQQIENSEANLRTQRRMTETANREIETLRTEVQRLTVLANLRAAPLAAPVQNVDSAIGNMIDRTVAAAPGATIENKPADKPADMPGKTSGGNQFAQLEID